MKKIVTLGVVAAMTASLCLTAYADNSSNVMMTKNAINIKQGNVVIANTNQVKPETKTIKGTVQEINYFGIKMQAEDKKVYVVPTGMLMDSKEYKSLNLKVGNSITVEGFDFEKMKSKQPVSIKLDENTGIQKNVVIFNEAGVVEKAVKAGISAEGRLAQKHEKFEVSKLNENESIFPAEKITANGVTIELQKIMTSFAAEAVKIETKEVKGTVKEVNEFGIRITGEDSKVYIVPTGMIADSKEFKSMNLKAGNSITVEGPDFEKMIGNKDGQNDVVFSTAPVVLSIEAEFKGLPEDAFINKQDIIVKAFDQDEVLKLDKDDVLFPAQKITANGVTIDLQKNMMEIHKPLRIQLQPNN